MRALRATADPPTGGEAEGPRPADAGGLAPALDAGGSDGGAAPGLDAGAGPAAQPPGALPLVVTEQFPAQGWFGDPTLGGGLRARGPP